VAADVKPVAASVPARMRSSLPGYWHDARPWQRFAYLVGGTLIAAGLYLLGMVLLGVAFLTALLALRKPTSAPA
jgi:hypothetical protein